MTTFTLPISNGSAVETSAPGCGEKIIQRISRPHLSELVKESCMTDADSELVLQTQSGSPAAFETLIRNHQRMIHSLDRKSVV